MPVFVSKRPMARVTIGDAARTPWRRWFAWYPVSDMNVTYWLTWVEWRLVKSSGFIGEYWAGGSHTEYRLRGGKPMTDTEADDLRIAILAVLNVKITQEQAQAILDTKHMLAKGRRLARLLAA